MPLKHCLFCPHSSIVVKFSALEPEAEVRMLSQSHSNCVILGESINLCLNFPLSKMRMTVVSTLDCCVENSVP